MSRASSKTTSQIPVYRIPFQGEERLPSKEAVGSKAHNLMRMARRGLSIPPGFVLGTEVCRAYMASPETTLAGISPSIAEAMHWLESATGTFLGDAKRPLLVSVRSGAAISMPGMMETILNIGLNDTALGGLLRSRGNPRLAYDCKRRLIQQYGEVVAGIPAASFDDVVALHLAATGTVATDEMSSAELAALADSLAEVYTGVVGQAFPADPRAQLDGAIRAVLDSWMSPRAIAYRKLHDIPDDLGTAVIVQAMVFGNAGSASGSGVGFTRNPGDGENDLYVDYLANAQGEDVVAGRRRAAGLDELLRLAPAAASALIAAAPLLEAEFGDMQDFEFTVADGRLYFLQCRSGKRMPLAALRIAVDQVAEGLLTPSAALERLAELDLAAIAIRRVVPRDGMGAVATGMPAGSGVAVGRIVFDPERVAGVAGPDKPVILARQNAETADIAAMALSAGLLTAEGARTSHAAVVARQMGKVCVVGCAALEIDPVANSAVVSGHRVQEGDTVSIDGTTGSVYLGAVDVATERPDALLDVVASWRGTTSATVGKRRKRP